MRFTLRALCQNFLTCGITCPLPPQLHALELHRADVALAQHGESVEALLAALFAPEAPDAAEGGWLGCCCCCWGQ